MPVDRPHILMLRALPRLADHFFDGQDFYYRPDRTPMIYKITLPHQMTIPLCHRPEGMFIEWVWQHLIIFTNDYYTMVVLDTRDGKEWLSVANVYGFRIYEHWLVCRVIGHVPSFYIYNLKTRESLEVASTGPDEVYYATPDGLYACNTLIEWGSWKRRTTPEGLFYDAISQCMRQSSDYTYTFTMEGVPLHTCRNKVPLNKYTASPTGRFELQASMIDHGWRTRRFPVHVGLLAGALPPELCRWIAHTF